MVVPLDTCRTERDAIEFVFWKEKVRQISTGEAAIYVDIVKKWISQVNDNLTEEKLTFIAGCEKG